MNKLAVYGVIGAAAVGYNMLTSVDRDESGAIVGSGDMGAFSIRLGDCFDNTGPLGGDSAGQVSSLPGVPCGDPHDNEVYAVFDVTMTEFPGDEKMSEVAFTECISRFAGFVGTDYQSSSLDVTSLYPSTESWNRQNDREVICAVYDMNNGKLTGSMKGAEI